MPSDASSPPPSLPRAEPDAAGMPVAEVTAVVDELERLGVRYQVNGGWAVDAHAGRQTRPHRDLDVFVDADRCPELVAWLQQRGYVVTTDQLPSRVELTGPNGIVDVHPMRLLPNGDAVQAGLGGEQIVHAAADRTRRWIGRTSVVVASAVRLRSLHAGYPPRPEDAHAHAVLDAIGPGVRQVAPEEDAVIGNRTLWTAVAAVLGVTVLTVALLVVGALSLPHELRTTMVAAAGFGHGVLMVAALWWVLRRDGLTVRRIGLRPPTAGIVHLLWQVPATFVVLLLSQATMVALLGDLPSNVSPSDYPGLLDSPVAVVLLVLATCVLAPVWEEIFFRGIVLGRLRHALRGRRGGTAAAVVLSAVIFACCHVVPPVLPYLTVLGVSLALVRLHHRTLWAPIVLHAVNNVLTTAVLLAALAQ